MEINWWYVVCMIGPLGLLGVIRASMSSYNDWKDSKQPTLTIAPREHVGRYEATLAVIVPALFQLELEDCLLTDESSLEDFAPEYPVALSLATLAEKFGINPEELADHRLVTICAALEEPASN